MMAARRGMTRWAGLVGTTVTADGLRLAAYGPDDHMRIVEGLSKDKMPHEQESLRLQRAATDTGRPAVSDTSARILTSGLRCGEMSV